MASQANLLRPAAHQFSWPLLRPQALSPSSVLIESAHFGSSYPFSATRRSISSRINWTLPLSFWHKKCKKSLVRSGDSERLFISCTASNEDDQNESLFDGIDILRALKNANSFIPHVVVASTLLALVFPPSFTWFTNRFAPRICSMIRPLLPPISVFVTALCVGSPLAMNINAIRSSFGLTILIPVVGFHALAFVAGYVLTGLIFSTATDVKGLQKTLSFETGMQSSLLGLTLANKFFPDPLVGVPSAISVVVMSLMGFALVVLWEKKR